MSVNDNILRLDVRALHNYIFDTPRVNEMFWRNLNSAYLQRDGKMQWNEPFSGVNSPIKFEPLNGVAIKNIETRQKNVKAEAKRMFVLRLSRRERTNNISLGE